MHLIKSEQSFTLEMIRAAQDVVLCPLVVL